MRDLYAKWQEPASMEEAERRRDEQAAIIQEIQTQLGCKDRTHADGARYTSHEFWQWRHRATVALTRANTEVRFLNRWIKDRHRRAHDLLNGAPALDPRDVASLLCNAHRVLTSAGRRLGFSSGEWAVVQAIEAWVTENLADIEPGKAPPSTGAGEVG